MRSRFLLGTATLVASIAVASAQQPMQGGEDGAPKVARPNNGASRRRPNPCSAAKIANLSVQAGSNHRPGSARAARSGQSQQRQRVRGRGSSHRSVNRVSKKANKGSSEIRVRPSNVRRSPQQGQQAPQRDQGQQGQQRDQGQTQQRQESPRQGQQAPQREQGQQKGQQGQQQGQAGSGNVSLTTDQRTKIKQTVLTSGAPRASNVNSAISVGTTVPERCVSWRFRTCWSRSGPNGAATCTS